MASDGTELHTRVVVRQNVVVAVLCPVAGKVGSVSGELRGHVNGTKLLQEELVVIGAHHNQFVHKTIDWDWGVLLQGW